MHILAFLMNIQHLWTNYFFQGWFQYILQLPCTPGDDHPPNHIHFWTLSVCVCVLIHFSHVRLSYPMDCSPQAPLSTGFPREEYWSRLPFPPPGDLPDSGIEPASLIPPELEGEFFTTSTTWEALVGFYMAAEKDVS